MRRRVDMLLVDDNEDDVLLLADAVETSEHLRIAGVVPDGVEALRYLRREAPYAGASRPDFIALDLNMPRKSGFDVLVELRRDQALAVIPVLVLTSSERLEDIARCRMLGVCACIPKPVDRPFFLRMVTEIEAFARWVLPKAEEGPGDEDPGG